MIVQSNIETIVAGLRYGLEAVTLKKCESYIYGNIVDFNDYKNQEEFIKVLIEELEA